MEFPLLCDGDDALIALQLCVQRPRAHAGELIIDAALVIHFWVEAFVALLDQAGVEHTLQRTIQSAWSHGNLSLRINLHLFHDPVAVPLSIGEGKQNVEHGRREWLDIVGDGHNPYLLNAFVSRSRVNQTRNTSNEDLLFRGQHTIPAWLGSPPVSI